MSFAVHSFEGGNFHFMTDAQRHRLARKLD